MNACAEPLLETAPPLAHRLLALLAPPDAADDPAPQARWLAALGAPQPLAGLLEAWWREPPPVDARLHRLVGALALRPAEVCAMALAFAADTDPLAGRAVAWLQAPLADPLPSLGLVAALQAHRAVDAPQALAELLDGAAVAAGVLVLASGAGRSLTDALLRLPQPLLAALAGGLGRWPGVSLGPPLPAAASGLPGRLDGKAPTSIDDGLAPLAPSARQAAARQAQSLGERGWLVVRSGHPQEARAAAAAVAAACGRRAAFVEGEPPAGLAGWLLLHDALPVLCADAAPGERRRASRPAGHRGPVLVATGGDGAWESDGDLLPGWSVPLPDAAERGALWAARLGAGEAAAELGRRYRHGSARIAQLAQAAAREAGAGGAGDGRAAGTPLERVARISRRAGGHALGALAELLPEDIADDAMVLPPALHAELAALLQRCRARDGLADGLGPAARARYRPGVRGLFVGPSGTGKTLAAGWIATRLGLPLYRVDIASVASKYIGETEKNLAELFGRAEHAEVVLLFDEADALFGRRTEQKDAHDRYANQQTNYLLQRIESFDGIVLMTSNSRSRFDPAFTRRLDAIVDFVAPSPAERRTLWLAHLGAAHALDVVALNRLAAACELAGGHVRNVVLAARAQAPAAAIAWPALAAALAAEYRKLGKPLPAALGD